MFNYTDVGKYDKIFNRTKHSVFVDFLLNIISYLQGLIATEDF